MPKTETDCSVPINPAVLRWARTTSGYSVDALVAKMKRKRVTADTIAQWESGASSPTYAQLERLAYEILKRPLALFFFPEPPEEETPKESFRTLPDSEIEAMEPAMRLLIRNAMVRRANLYELYDGVNPSQRQIIANVSVQSPRAVSSAATTVRKYLDADKRRPPAGSERAQALKTWRRLLEEHGVFIFKAPFKLEGYSGFCLYDEVFPIIVVNNSHPKNRQIFTLFHELGHLLMHTGGVDFDEDDEFLSQIHGQNRRIEQFCNAFASDCLVPSARLDGLLRGKTVDDELLQNLSNEYCVSREVILRKCIDLGLISQRFYDQAVRRWRSSRRASTGSGGDYYNNQWTYLGEPYVEQAFSKYYQHRISQAQLAEFLGVQSSSIAGMEAKLMGAHS